MRNLTPWSLRRPTEVWIPRPNAADPLALWRKDVAMDVENHSGPLPSASRLDHSITSQTCS